MQHKTSVHVSSRMRWLSLAFIAIALLSMAVLMYTKFEHTSKSHAASSTILSFQDDYAGIKSNKVINNDNGSTVCVVSPNTLVFYPGSKFTVIGMSNPTCAPSTEISQFSISFTIPDPAKVSCVVTFSGTIDSPQKSFTCFDVAP
jgi:hypothetical protein